MKFRIVENPDPLEDIDVDEFKEDYKNLTMEEMCKKYNTHNKKIYKLRKQLGLSPKQRKMPKEYSFAKYYFYSSNSDTWKVQKRNENFGTFHTEEEAKKVVEFLKKNNWSKEKLQKFMPKSPKYFYFQKKSNSWIIQKGSTYFGIFKTEEEAKKVVEFLKKNNWDKELLLKNKNKIFKEADKHKEK